MRAFDDDGHIRKGEFGIGYVLTKVFNAHPGIELMMLGGIPEEMLRRAGKP